jgi:hypothetical protein
MIFLNLIQIIINIKFFRDKYKKLSDIKEEDFKHEHILSEIGDILNLNKERIRQIEQEVFRDLRRHARYINLVVE